jgi:hypothetical protein
MPGPMLRASSWNAAALAPLSHWTLILVLGIWSFFGFWGLGFGDSTTAFRIRVWSVFHPWLLRLIREDAMSAFHLPLGA